jgi:hypothetical protein
MSNQDTITESEIESIFTRLANADPVDLAGEDTAKRAALFRSITAQPAGGGAVWRRPTVLAGGAVAVAVLGAITTAAILRGGGGGTQVAPDPTAGTVDPGGFAGMCAEMYSPEGLVRREWAFDGTVTSIDGYVATFEVHNWFKGGGGDSFAAEAGPLLGTTSVGDDTVLAVGERYLVSGDETFAWGCGFSKPYSDDLAAEWKELL